MATAPPEKKPHDVEEELKRVFNQFDSNGDGKISVGELGEVFKAMGNSYSAEELTHVMEDFDADHDGFIDFDEFGRLCRSSSSAGSPELRDAFELYDENHDGKISSAELHQVLLRLRMKCSLEDCAKMIATVDADGDGSVNFEEFEKMMGATIAPAPAPAPAPANN